MKRFYQDYNRIKVYQVKELLEDNGIPVMLKNEMLQGAVGEVPPQDTNPEVWLVDNEWETKANQLLAEFESDLIQLATEESWTCPQCNEMNEGNFSICFNCQTVRP